ncbi:hypothetical protein NMY22_g13313 [Coprinellus aureogranulatus]|nr:hypothetical protein NMY22_g13313 [Coprinellus aureogranulatus]
MGQNEEQVFQSREGEGQNDRDQQPRPPDVAETESELKQEERNAASVPCVPEADAMQRLTKTADRASPTTEATAGRPSQPGPGNAAQGNRNIDTSHFPSVVPSARNGLQVPNHDPAAATSNEYAGSHDQGGPLPTPPEGSNSATIPDQVARTFNVNARNVNAGILSAVSAGRDVIMMQPEQRDRGWKILMRHTSPNAIHTSYAVSRLSRCDTGTRVEVLRRIGHWARGTQQHLLCLTGAAGSGKTAIALTSGEEFTRGEDRLLVATFIFSSMDDTRNNLSTLIPTIACQIGSHDARLRSFIAAAVERDEHVVTASLKMQATRLIVEPFVNSRVPLRPVILLDGIDQCLGEDNQEHLLSLLSDASLWGRTPFRLLITARPELEKEYDATDDIKRTLQLHLSKLLGRSAADLEKDIDIIVDAASGQYIYPATVIKYVSAGRRDSPSDRLRIIVQWISSPETAGDPPFPLQSLYDLYSNILSTAADAFAHPSIGDRKDPFALLVHVFASVKIPTAPKGMLESGLVHDRLLGFNENTFKSVLHDMGSLARAREPTETGPLLHFYHRTCLDFLQDGGRARSNFYRDKAGVDAYIFKRLYGVFVPLVQRLEANLAAGKDGLVVEDEEFWRTCTSASLLGGVLQSQLSAKEIKRFARDKGWEKLKELVGLAKKYPHFADNDLVKTTLAQLRTLRDSQNTEIAAQARDIFDAIDVKDG